MNGWIESFAHFIYGASLLLSVLGVWFTIVIPGIDRWSRRFFRIYFIIFMLSCLSGIVDMAFQYYIVPRALYYCVLILETLLLSLPFPMMTVYLLHCCSENMRRSKLFYTVLGLWAVFFVILAIAPLSGGIVYVTSDNQYYRGPLYPLLQAPIIIRLLLNLAGTIRRRTRLSRKTFLSFIIAHVPMTVIIIVNLFVDIIPLFELSYVLSVLSMYSLILSDQIEKDLLHQREIAQQQREIAQQQREIAQQRASVMVLQMRPHFIYNTLTSIYSLCRVDPPKARQVTKDFSNYLRRNFNAVASDNTIPFSTELEHTRAYLAVEQAQYDDMLVVEYDTPFTRFRLPPLTLQPIVENAVKHGMDPYSSPLHISIRTRHTDSGTEIIIEDNGRGFDPSDESMPHTTLTNIRQRLEMMCGGTMQIEPGSEDGTRVIIWVPVQSGT